MCRAARRLVRCIATTLGFGATIVPLAAFVGALVAVAAAFVVARAAGSLGDPRVLLMAGVVVGAFANAAIMVMLANAESNTVRNALWWMMGSVADATWTQIAILLVYVAAGGAALVLLGRQIDILALGEDAAAGLGVDVDRAMRNVFVVASLIAAATVAAAGLVGFVGLVVPHIVRAAGIRHHRSARRSARRSWERRSSCWPTCWGAYFALRPSFRSAQSLRSSECRSFSSSCGAFDDSLRRRRRAISARDDGRAGRRIARGAARRAHGRRRSERERKEHARSRADRARAR